MPEATIKGFIDCHDKNFSKVFAALCFDVDLRHYPHDSSIKSMPCDLVVLSHAMSTRFNCTIAVSAP